MSKQAAFRWNPDRPIDKALLDVLSPFRTHARSRRLKELAMLGLLAERAGLRVDGDRLVGAVLDTTIRLPYPAPLPAAPPPALPLAETGPLALDREALEAGNDLLASFGVQ